MPTEVLIKSMEDVGGIENILYPIVSVSLHKSMRSIVLFACKKETANDDNVSGLGWNILRFFISFSVSLIQTFFVNKIYLYTNKFLF